MEYFTIAEAIVGIVGIPVAVYSLFLLGRQTRNLENSIRSQVYQGLTENAFRIDETLIQYPEFRKYVYGGAEVNEQTPDLDRLLMVIELIVDVFENLNVQQKNIPPPVLASWDHYKSHVLSTPAVAYYFKTHGDWYSQELKKPLTSEFTASQASLEKKSG